MLAKFKTYIRLVGSFFLEGSFRSGVFFSGGLFS